MTNPALSLAPQPQASESCHSRKVGAAAYEEAWIVSRAGMYRYMVRVLVTVSPRMYREAIALSIHRNRPDLDVRIAPPEATEKELARFRPHLLVYNDTAQISEEVLEGVPCRLEVLYSDSMSSRLHADGLSSEAHDASTEDLIRALDSATALAGREAG